MIKPIKSILFSTNLSDNCKPALDLSISLATRYQASLVFLHVIEEMPDYAENRLRGLLGENKWRELNAEHQKSAYQQLIGKRSTSRMIRTALEKYCDEAGIEEASCGFQSREIVLTDGDLIDDIIKTSKQHKCDLIVMGARKGWLKDNAIGARIKQVLRRSTVPVLVVPPVMPES